MKNILMMSAFILLTATSFSQINNAKTETVKVFGNCGMCETTIEKAGSKKKVFKTDWNEDTQMATITYDSAATNLDAILKNIALVGYDSDKFLAPDEVYAKLHGCCKYERTNKQVAKTPMAKEMKDDMKGHENHMHDGMDHKMMKDTASKMKEHEHDKKEVPAKMQQQADQLKPVFDHYFALKDALVKTDGTTASAKATALLNALNAVKMETLKTDEHNVWMKVQKDLKFNAEHIAETKDPGHQRDHFIVLSKGMYDLVKAANLSETIYYQHCPMANDGKGANWLSKESVIRNPYYGSKMLSCGKVVETINK